MIKKIKAFLGIVSKKETTTMFKDAVELNNIYLAIKNNERFKYRCVSLPLSRRITKEYNLSRGGMGDVIAGYIEMLENEVKRLKDAPIPSKTN